MDSIVLPNDSKLKQEITSKVVHQVKLVISTPKSAITVKNQDLVKQPSSSKIPNPASVTTYYKSQTMTQVKR